ncbi:MAG: hypothetical protein ACLVKO_09000 [Dysgonomonas sp.]
MRSAVRFYNIDAAGYSYQSFTRTDIFIKGQGHSHLRLPCYKRILYAHFDPMEYKGRMT